MPIKIQIGENDLTYDNINDLISDFEPETNNFVESIQNPKNGDVFFHYSTDKKKLDDRKSNGMNWCSNVQKNNK